MGGGGFGVVSIEDADPRAAFLDDEENRRSNCRVGSISLIADVGQVILENTRAAAPSGAQVAVREESA